MIEVTEKAGNDSQGNWTENAKEPSYTARDDGGENERRRRKRFLSNGF
jgi:hypothetical protein